MDLAEQLARDGYALARAAIDRRRVDELIAAVSAAGGYAIRNLLDVVPETAALARSPEVLALVNGVLGAKAFPVGGILFDKTPAVRVPEASALAGLLADLAGVGILFAFMRCRTRQRTRA